ncbi:hypothetical protein V8D89_003784 [Ganoderma adspersum]
MHILELTVVVVGIVAVSPSPCLAQCDVRCVRLPSMHATVSLFLIAASTVHLVLPGGIWPIPSFPSPTHSCTASPATQFLGLLTSLVCCACMDPDPCVVESI